MARMPLTPLLVVLVSVAGCTSEHLASSNAGIHHALLAPSLPPAPPAAEQLPAPPAPSVVPGDPKKDKSLPATPHPESAPADATTGPLELHDVLTSVEQHFPLLLAIAEERNITAGQRLAAEGAFDLNLRTRGSLQDGTYNNQRLDVSAEQPTTLYGISVFSGYRLSSGDFPVYYGDRKTADDGEFRAGLIVPLLKDGPIDRRRAALRQAQITESLADPIVQRARLDYFRAAARAYWNWVAAGAQYRVAEALLRLGKDRQAGFEQQFKLGQIGEFVVIDNRRLIAEREGTLLGAERRFQQTSFDLSLFWRDASGNPVVPAALRLPRGFVELEPTPPSTERLRDDIDEGYRLRPELVRLALLKSRVAVELQLAQNQALPAVNAAIVGAQDAGYAKKSPGIFALDRSLMEASVMVEVPLQRREATGRTRAAQAALAQLLGQERFLRDSVAAEIQDAVSNLDRTYQRLQRAREEQRIARRVADLERDRFTKGQSNLLEVNLRELSAAGAEAKVIETLADFFRAQAEHRAAVGRDARPEVPPR